MHVVPSMSAYYYLQTNVLCGSLVKIYIVAHKIL